MTERSGKKQENLYRITVKGALDSRWAGWFNGLQLEPLGENKTILIGRVVDQAALHGILGKIRDLGLTLLSVCMFEEPDDSKGDQHVDQI